MLWRGGSEGGPLPPVFVKQIEQIAPSVSRSLRFRSTPPPLRRGGADLVRPITSALPLRSGGSTAEGRGGVRSCNAPPPPRFREHAHACFASHGPPPPLRRGGTVAHTFARAPREHVSRMTMEMQFALSFAHYTAVLALVNGRSANNFSALMRNGFSKPQVVHKR